MYSVKYVQFSNINMQDILATKRINLGVGLLKKANVMSSTLSGKKIS